MAEYIKLEDAIAIIEEKQKELCPVGRYGRGYVYGSDFVEQWCTEHPVKTRQSVFLKQFPNAPIYTNTHNVALDPYLVDTALRGHCPTGRGCDICRREFWLTEVE